MTVTATSFIEMFPEFQNPATYPAATITFYLSLGYLLLPPVRWGTLLDYGVALFTAHHVAIAAANIATAAAAGIPGTDTAIISSKTIDKVSAGYDVNAGIIPNAAYYNLTNYGVQFYQLVLQFGAGGFVTGGGPLPIGPGIGWGNGNGWPF